jgi:hypothetical protein
VADELPSGILEPSLGEDGPRRVVPGFAPAVAAIVILLAATAVALGPGGIGPAPTPVPTPTATLAPSPTAAPTARPVGLFRTTAAIRGDLETLTYVCQVGEPLSSIGPGPNAVLREAAVCVAPAAMGPFMAAVIVGEGAGAGVVEVHAKADMVGDDTSAARAAVASTFAKVAAISSAIASAGNEMGNWVNATLPTIEPSGGEDKIINGFDVKIARNANGGYLLIVHLAIG